jgi:hypothetical protein
MGRTISLAVGLAAALCLLSAASAEPDKVLYELQERCARQAANFFKTESGGEHVVKTKDGTMLEDYENHYSSRLNKCFYLQISNHFSKTSNFKSLQLYEINEHKQYGGFTSGIGECAMLDRLCRTEQEWRELAKPFLEDR